MNKYELALVLSPALDDEGRAAEVAKVQAVLERFGAKIEKVDDWGKRKLAYEIQKVNEGFYSFTTFEAPASAPAEIEAIFNKVYGGKELTQEEMAARLGVTAPAVNKWENGNSLPDIALTITLPICSPPRDGRSGIFPLILASNALSSS